MASLRRELPRNVRLLIGIRAARSVGQGALVAAFTLYLNALGWSGSAIGSVLMAALLLSTALTALVGPLSDRGHRRAFLLIYDLVQILVALVALLTTVPWLLVGAAVIGGFGRGGNGAAGPFSPVEQAWMAVELPMEKRSRIFSANSAVGLIGMGVGALAAALPTLWAGRVMTAADYQLLFALPLTGGIISFFLLLLTREPRLSRASRASVAEPATLQVHRTENRLLARLVLANVFNGLGVGMVGPLIAYWFALRFQRGLAEIGPGLALAFFISALGAFIAGEVARRKGIMLTVLWMRGVGIVCLLLMPVAPWFALAMLLYVARGAANRGTGGVRQALAAGLTRAERRGLASSLQNISFQLPRAIGPAIGGALFHAGYLVLPFMLGAALQLIYLVLYVRFFGQHPAATIRDRPT